MSEGRRVGDLGERGHDEDDTEADMQRKEESAHKSTGEMIQFLQRAIGYSLYGTTSEKVLLIPWGIGDNGKSTFIETIADILGSGYAIRASTDMFLSKREGSVRNDVAQLKGVRFAYAAEPPQDRRLDESLIKELTGGDTVSARFLFSELFTFRPECTLWMSTNHKPPTRDTGNALWNRIKLIPFTVSIPKEEQDRNLRAKLLEEAPGILAWAVRGCLDWQQKGLNEPEAVQEATAGYREENDNVEMFLQEHCLLSNQVQVKSSELYEAYRKYCEQEGEYSLNQKRFSMALKEKGYESYKNVVIWFRGIGLQED